MWQCAQALLKRRIVLDAIMIGDDAHNPDLITLAKITNGYAFLPDNISEVGPRIFTHGSILMGFQRIRRHILLVVATVSDILKFKVLIIDNAIHCRKKSKFDA